jgi:hypothetical protein
MRGWIAAALVASAVAAAGAQAPVVNARLERRAVTQGLAREIQTVVDRGVAAWIGYSVPLLRRTNAGLGSSDWYGGRCRLEPPAELVVLARVEGKALVDLRSLSIDCDVDAGGMPLVWLDGVSADESVKWLASMVSTTQPTAPPTAPRDRLANAALAALARHASPAAAAPLVDLARNSTTTQMRGRALSLLAQRSATESLATITAAVDQDPDKGVRRQAVTALGRLPDGAGIPRLMELARTHKDVDVRRQAMLSLGQSRDPRAIDFFGQILNK